MRCRYCAGSIVWDRQEESYQLVCLTCGRAASRELTIPEYRSLIMTGRLDNSPPPSYARQKPGRPSGMTREELDRRRQIARQTLARGEGIHSAASESGLKPKTILALVRREKLHVEAPAGA